MSTFVVTKHPVLCSRLTTCGGGNRSCKNHLSGADNVLIATHPHRENIHGTLGATEPFRPLPALLLCLLRGATPDFPCAFWSDNLSMPLTYYDSIPEGYFSCSCSYTSLQKIPIKFGPVSNMLIIPLTLNRLITVLGQRHCFQYGFPSCLNFAFIDSCYLNSTHLAGQ